MPRPLRFCMITTFYPPYSFGGDAVYAQQLSNALAERGHHVEVIHCLDAYQAVQRGESPHTAPDHPNVILHRLASRVGALSPLATQQTGYPFFKSRQIKEILAQGFDVIHYHNLSLVGGPGLLHMGDAIKLYTTHEYWLVCPTNVLYRYDGVACDETRCLRCTLAYHRPPQWWRYTNMLKNALEHVDLFLHPSIFSMTKHRAMGLTRPGMVLPYFHAPPPAPANEVHVAGDKPYFLYVGRLEHLKGAHTLIPTFREYPRARLVIVGEGSQTPELQGLADGSPNIIFLGWLEHARIGALLRDATALLVPSLCYENGPLVPIEAFYHGTPSLGRRLGTLPEILEGTGGGLMYTDDASLVAGMDAFLDNPTLRNEMGERGRATYYRQYTPEVHFRNYFEIIDRLARDRSKGMLPAAIQPNFHI